MLTKKIENVYFVDFTTNRSMTYKEALAYLEDRIELAEEVPLEELREIVNEVYDFDMKLAKAYEVILDLRQKPNAQIYQFPRVLKVA